MERYRENFQGNDRRPTNRPRSSRQFDHDPEYVNMRREQRFPYDEDSRYGREPYQSSTRDRLDSSRNNDRFRGESRNMTGSPDNRYYDRRVEERYRYEPATRERRDSGSPYSGSPRATRKEGGTPNQGDYGYSRDAQNGRNPTMGGQPYFRNQGMNFNEDLHHNDRAFNRNYGRDRNYDRDRSGMDGYREHYREDRFSGSYRGRRNDRSR